MTEKESDTLLFRTVLLFSVIFGLLETFAVGLTIDSKALLHYTLHMMQGGLYDRWMPANLPLPMWLFSIPAACIVTLHVPAWLAVHVFGFFLGLLSLGLLLHSLKAHSLTLEEQHRWLSMSACALCIAPAFFSVFSDREHLLFIFATPWLVQMLLQRKPLISTICFAAIGFCIKPYNLLIFLTVLLTAGPAGTTLKQRIFSPSAFIVGGVALCYAFAIYFIFPDYIEKILPLSTVTYPIYRPGLLKIFAVSAIIIIPALMFVRMAQLPQQQYRGWYGLIAGCFLAYCLNGYWVYALYLVVYPLSFTLLMALHACHKKKISFGSGLLYIAIIVFLSLSIGHLTLDITSTRKEGYAFNYPYLPDTLLQELRAEAGKEFILIAQVPWGSTIEGTAQPPASVFAYNDMIWPLVWLMKNPDDPRTPHIWHMAITEALLRAINDYPDATIIEDESPNQKVYELDINIFSYIQRDPEIQKALASYERKKIIDHCTARLQFHMCRYGIWRRRNTNSTATGGL